VKLVNSVKASWISDSMACSTVPFPFYTMCFTVVCLMPCTDHNRLTSIVQGISAIGAFFELLSQPILSVQHPEENKQVAPAELCPILKRLYRILIKRSVS
jgi:hypothetical protein